MFGTEWKGHLVKVTIEGTTADASVYGATCSACTSTSETKTPARRQFRNESGSP